LDVGLPGGRLHRLRHLDADRSIHPNHSASFHFYGPVVGTVTGEPIAGASVSIGSSRFATDEGGRFEGPRADSGVQSVTISGEGIVNRVTYVNLDSGDVALDVIQEKPPFDLAFFRKFVRNGFEAPEGLIQYAG
jgi:hypothetical protein